MNDCDKMEHYIVHKGKLFDYGAASNQMGQRKLDLRSILIMAIGLKKKLNNQNSVKLEESDRGQNLSFFWPRL